MEVEYYALVEAARQGIGMQRMLKDMGVHLDVALHCDNQSALDFTRKQGLGKSKHFTTGLLWLQDAVEARELKLKKVHTYQNLADIMTKYLSGPTR